MFSTIFYSVFAFLLLVLVIWLSIKYEVARTIFVSAFMIIILVSAIFSGYHLDKYYNTAGGIVGKLTEIFNPNKVNAEQSKNVMTFRFDNVMLTKTEGEVYSAEFSLKETFKLDEEDAYVVYVNDIPCEILQYSDETSDVSYNYLKASYTYAFKDKNNEFILKDTLTMSFAFYNNSTKVIVETSGEQQAVSLWNAYFKTEDFVVTIKGSNTVYMTEFKTITLQIRPTLNEKIKVKKGSVYVLPQTYELDGYRLLGWSFENFGVNNIEDTKIIITEDIKLYADMRREYSVNFRYTTENQSAGDSIYYVAKYIVGENLSAQAPTEDPTKVYYNFLGWSFSSENAVIQKVVNLSDYVFDIDITDIYAVFEPKQILVNVNLNGGLMSIRGQTYTENFMLNYYADEDIVLNQPTKELHAFAGYNVSVGGVDKIIGITDSSISMTATELRLAILGDSVNYPSFDDEEYSDEYLTFNVECLYSSTDSNSDQYKKEYIAFNLGLNYTEDEYSEIIVYDSKNEDFIRDLYEELTYTSSSDKTLLEVEIAIAETLELSLTITSDTTTSEFLDSLYNYCLNVYGEQ